MKISVSNMRMRFQNWIWMDMRLADWQSVNRMKRCTGSWMQLLPHLMGVGTPANILEAIEEVDRGVDFFDCVYPTRNGRHGHVYTNHGKMNLFNAKYELDDRPIEEGCQCPACRQFYKGVYPTSAESKRNAGNASVCCTVSIS